MPHDYIRVRFVGYEGMAAMPGSQRRAPGHRRRLEFRMSRQVVRGTNPQAGRVELMTLVNSRSNTGYLDVHVSP